MEKEEQKKRLASLKPGDTAYMVKPDGTRMNIDDMDDAEFQEWRTRMIGKVSEILARTAHA